MLKESDLGQFYCTTAYHAINPLFPNVLMTDGAKHVAEAGGAWWLMDLIAAHVYEIARRNNNLSQIQFWQLSKHNDNSAIVECREDSNIPPVFVESLTWTDFPLDSIKLFVQPSGDSAGTFWVIMLPSEY